MKQDKQQTAVVFRKFKEGGDIMALFPYNAENNYMCTSYQHIGQHSDADYHHCVNISTPAKESEYKDLKKELEGIGCNLRVIKRAQRNKMYK